MAEPGPVFSEALGIVLGASVFPRAPKLADGRAFYNSAADFKDYLTAPRGLGLHKRDVLWLFDDSKSPADQLQAIATFLQQRSKRHTNQVSSVQDLILYYVGHGLFTRSDQSYCLAIRETSETNEGASSIRASDLASTIKDNARYLRRFLILDCCFAASAYREFQSAPLQAARVQTLQEFPTKGTALLCSSNSRDASLAPEGLSHTMFSDALLRALKQGHAFLGARLSISDLGNLIRETLEQQYSDGWVRPEVLSPDQREGDVAWVPLFPNPAFRTVEGQRETQEQAEQVTLTKEDDEAERLRNEEAEHIVRSKRAEVVGVQQPDPERVLLVKERTDQTSLAKEKEVQRKAADAESPEQAEQASRLTRDKMEERVARWTLFAFFAWPLLFWLGVLIGRVIIAQANKPEYKGIPSIQIPTEILRGIGLFWFWFGIVFILGLILYVSLVS